MFVGPENRGTGEDTQFLGTHEPPKVETGESHATIETRRSVEEIVEELGKIRKEKGSLLEVREIPTDINNAEYIEKRFQEILDKEESLVAELTQAKANRNAALSPDEKYAIGGISTDTK